MKRKVITFIELIFLIIIAFSVYNIIVWYKDNKKNDEIVKEIKNNVKIDEATKEYSVDFKALKKQNPDTIAYLIINNPKIEYPVVKTKDNDYYLNHNFNKEYNKGGWIFANYKNNFDDKDRNIVLFGHNMKNGSMFGTLKQVLTDEWLKDEKNRDIILYTENKKYEFKIFSAYRTKVEEYYLSTRFSSDNDYLKFLNTLNKRSFHNFNTNFDSDDIILTLSTCSGDNYRVVVHAKLIN